MFEQSLEDMKAIILVESGMYNSVTSDNVGVSPEIIFEGDHEYTFSEAISVINALDKASKGCPKYLIKRITSLKKQFSYAFGPDMLRHLGME